MNYLDAALLGAIQGLTEFLPVSSSGHLVLAEAILQVKKSGVTFEVLLHVGTLFSVLVYFRRRISSLLLSLFRTEMIQERALVGYLIAASIPAGLAGFLLKDFLEQAFSEPFYTAMNLIMTGFILLLPRFFRKGSRPMGLTQAFIMGVGQAVAILPGISRSGTTITSGLISGVKPEQAAEFSFLMSIPVICGAALLDARGIMSIDATLMGQYLVGMLVSFLSGLFAVYAVLSLIKRGKFSYFALYCFVAGGFGLYLFW